MLGFIAALSLNLAGRGSSRGKEGGTLILGATPLFLTDLNPQLSYTVEGWTATSHTYIPSLTYADASSGVAGSKVIRASPRACLY